MRDVSCVLIFNIFGIIISEVLCQKNENILKSLENEKSKVKQQINEAIDDIVLTLQKNNDTDAAEGVDYINNLKSQLQDISSTEIEGFNNENATFLLRNNTVTKSITNKSIHILNLRRSRKKKFDKIDELDKVFDVDRNLYSKIPKKNAELMLNHRLNLEKKINEWLFKRQEEKKRLKEYLEKKRQELLRGQSEKCPRYGFGKNKKKKSKKFRRKKDTSSEETRETSQEKHMSKTIDAVDTARFANRKKRKYPCCRKCCKKSYLGCL